MYISKFGYISEKTLLCIGTYENIIMVCMHVTGRIPVQWLELVSKRVIGETH